MALMPVSFFVTLSCCSFVVSLKTTLCIAAFQALFEKLVKGSSSEERKSAAQDVVTEMKQGGAASFAVSSSHPSLFAPLLSKPDEYWCGHYKSECAWQFR